MLLRLLLLPHQTLLLLQLLHPGIAGTQTQDHSCWIQPVSKGCAKLSCIYDLSLKFLLINIKKNASHTEALAHVGVSLS